MSAADWFIALFCLSAGTGILAYWIAAVVFDAFPVPWSNPAIVGHVVGEMLTGAVLVGAGLARLATDAPWADVLAGVALGGLAYAFVGSPGFYPGERRMHIGFAVGGAVTALAIGLLFV